MTNSLLQDIRFGLRTMVKSPGITVIAVITLALGIGANSAMFSVVDAVLLRPLPFRDPSRLVRIYTHFGGTQDNATLNGLDYIDYQAQNHSFAETSLFSTRKSYNASGAGEPAKVTVLQSQANFFSVLGAQAAIGRTFAPGEDQSGRTHEVVLSYGFWQEHFGGRADAVGRTLQLNNEPYTVIGVMPRDFGFPSRVQVWTPIEMVPQTFGTRGGFSYNAIARLKPGVSVAQGSADVSGIAGRIAQQYPHDNYGVTAVAVPLKQDITGDSRSALLVLLGAVTLLLLVACANIANLMLARATARQREMALRLALGATRGRIVRQLLTESFLLSGAGATLGLAMAWWCVELVRATPSLPIPQQTPIELNLAVLGFTFFISIAVGVLFGLAPAIQSSSANLADDLKAAAQSVGASIGRARLRDALVVAEIALCLALLVGAGLLLRTFHRLRNAAGGLDPHNVVTMRFNLPHNKQNTPSVRRQFYERLLDRVGHEPGVSAASVSMEIPLEYSRSGSVAREGTDPSRDAVSADWNVFAGDYFHAFGIGLIEGRSFMQADIDQAARASALLDDIFKRKEAGTLPVNTPPVEMNAIINHALASKLWPGQDPLGKVFQAGLYQRLTVIGVAADSNSSDIRDAHTLEVYGPLTSEIDNPFYPWNVTVRSSATPGAVVAAVRHDIGELDPTLPVYGVRTMRDVIADSMQDTTMQTVLLGIFAVLGLILAAVGLYGVMAYLVTQRTREIGIRMALGAQTRNVRLMVLGRAARLTLLGTAAGMAAALLLTRLLKSLLFGVTTTDPATLAGVACVLALVALAAAYIPARRATRVDPMVALRYE